MRSDCWITLPLRLAVCLAALCATTLKAQTAAAAPAAAMPGEHLVWFDEFNGATAPTPPSPANWVFETGDDGWGNHELETYCAPGSDAPPCTAAQPNAFVTADGLLHLIARRVPGQTTTTRYTSARLKTAGLRSFRYGRLEARIRIPGGAGIWPAFWMLGGDIATTPWPACGEIDIMENIGREPALIHGSLHGTGFPAAGLTASATLPGRAAFSTAGFHRYGMIWSPKRIQFYLDDPSHPYASFTPADMPPGAVWPFDGRPYFFLLNLAVGGDWPGPLGASTPFPAEMLVDYVRVWQQDSVR